MLHNHTWSGTFTAQTSIAHGGTSSDTLHSFRVEKFLTPDGNTTDIPVISGATIRHSIRQISGKTTIAKLYSDDESVPATIQHLMLDGGILRQAARTKDMITAGKQAAIRENLPHLALFGAATTARVMQGALIVDKAIPLIAQTAHLTPEHAESPRPDLADILTLEQRSSHDTSSRLNNAAQRAGDSTNENAIRWHVQTIIPGTQFAWSIQARCVTPTEAGYLNTILTRWAKDARIGGNIASGHGKITLNVTHTAETLDGNPTPQPPMETWEPDIAAARNALTPCE